MEYLDNVKKYSKNLIKPPWFGHSVHYWKNVLF